MPAEDEDRVLDYGGPEARCPVRTRIQVEQTPDGCRFIDPPGAPEGVREYRGTTAVLILVALFLVTSFLASRQLNRHALWLPIFVTLGFLWVSCQFYAASKRLASLPTVIEIDREGLSLSHPLKGDVYLRWNEVERIYRDSAFSGWSDWMNCLVIAASGKRRYTMLNSRPSAEVEWLVKQLNYAVRHPVGSAPACPPEARDEAADAALPVVAGYRCPGCGAFDSDSEYRIDKGRIVKCRACGRRFINSAVSGDVRN
jgi:hypothetical protein